MDKIDLQLKAYQKLSEKEAEYEEFILNHKHQLQTYDEQRMDLHQRWVELQRLIENEYDFMQQFVASLDALDDELGRYGEELNALAEESEFDYRHRMTNIDYDESVAREHFYKKQVDYEDNIERLRKRYASTY